MIILIDFCYKDQNIVGIAIWEEIESADLKHLILY